MAEAARPQFGVPFFERAYGWVLVRVVAMLPAEPLLARFQRVSDTLVALCPEREAAGTRRVLVRRFAGIEESSRNWSGAMVLEHLAIVGRHVITLTEAQAEEMRGSGVTINTIVPSIIDTPANRASMPSADISRWPTPEQLARVVLFLASDDAALISGAAIPVYGAA